MCGKPALTFKEGTERRFRFQLARELGMTVAELKNMDADEYQQWQLFYNVEAEEREQAENGEVPKSSGSRKVVTDPARLQSWFDQNS